MRPDAERFAAGSRAAVYPYCKDPTSDTPLEYFFPAMRAYLHAGFRAQAGLSLLLRAGRMGWAAAVIKHEIATRKAHGLPPLMEADAGWQIVLRSLSRYQEACSKAGFSPDQPRDERGRWTDGGDPRPDISAERPAAALVRNRIIKEAIKWATKAGARELAGPVGTFLNLAEAASWLYEAYPYVRAYFDSPKALNDLQAAVQERRRAMTFTTSSRKRSPQAMDTSGRSLRPLKTWCAFPR
jgi:hypothetical protein